MKPTHATRILIVDDHAMVRLALAEAIERHDDLQLAGEAENGAQAIELYRALRPDVVTMDFKLPDRNGDEVIAAITAEFPDARILLLSIFETEECVYQATQAGALGCVTKAAEIEEMIAGIRAVARGERYFNKGLAAKLDERLARESLSTRELKVIGQLAAGATNKQIASALGISGSTVKHHLESIFTKLDAKDRTQAVTTAVIRGIIDLKGN